jgi:hypothetical protein
MKSRRYRTTENMILAAYLYSYYNVISARRPRVKR